ncbi:hypothetical protein TH3_21928 (plasmid) [Thalassospira xiamenensis M-5 = DSM 17429]|uniref:Uncharacterized protein n=1 Tax=Thalassospira xiamenensis M-5 = DSM 17429 TaxID=1123366 RepID=A0AB72ULM8_9PROT|nr:hypothetical protein TH3_21928 [Thalassospira xiamenensis M-5 = DSM 17429]
MTEIRKLPTFSFSKNMSANAAQNGKTSQVAFAMIVAPTAITRVASKSMRMHRKWPMLQVKPWRMGNQEA